MSATYSAPAVSPATSEDSPALEPREPFYLELEDVKAFRDSLARVTKALERKSYVQVLGAVELAVIGEHGSRLELTCTNQSLVIRETLELGATASRGRAVIDGRTLLAAVKTLAGPIEFELAAGKLASFVIRQGSSTLILPALEPADYPSTRGEGFEPASRTDSDPHFVAGRSDLVRAFGAVAKAYSRDESRPVLTGVRLELEGSRLVLAATDSYRLAVDGTDGYIAGETWPAGFTVRGAELAKVIALATKTRDGSPLEFELVLDGPESVRRLVIRDGSRTAILRTIDGQYPDWRKLVQNDYPSRVTFDSAAAITALERIESVIGKTAPVSFTWPASESANGRYGELVLEGSIADGAMIRETLDGAFAGIDMPAERGFTPSPIGFNPRFMIDAIAAAGADRVTVWTINPLRPALVTSSEVQVLRADGLAGHEWTLVMPIRLKG